MALQGNLCHAFADGKTQEFSVVFPFLAWHNNTLYMVREKHNAFALLEQYRGHFTIAARKLCLRWCTQRWQIFAYFFIFLHFVHILCSTDFLLFPGNRWIMIEMQRIFLVNGRICDPFKAFQKVFAHYLTAFLLYRFSVIFDCLSFCNGRKYQPLYSMTIDNE